MKKYLYNIIVTPCVLIRVILVPTFYGLEYVVKWLDYVTDKIPAWKH